MKITKPTVLLNWQLAEANLDRMLDRAQRHGLRLRPHLKTAQSQIIAGKFRDKGVSALTVSSLSMAEYFAGDGANDITIAFPVNLREIASINRLAEKISLNLLVVNPESTAQLRQQIRQPVGIFIKIDVGTHRTGLLPGDEAQIEAHFAEIESSDLLTFQGFLAHAGHSYSARSEADILRVHKETTTLLRQLKEKYRYRYPNLQLSPGDTPTCSVAEFWEGMDEIRPGNFIFYDLMQVQIHSCKVSDIAVTLACPIVAKHIDRQEVIIYGGGIHLSKDRLEWKGKTIYGLPVVLHADGWELPEEDCYLRAISQEHGVIKCTPALFDKLSIGGLVGILPVHSCMMVDLADRYLTTDGEVWEKM